MSIETITKIDAAKRQLDTAITLWFSEADTVSIHTLACSAHQIIHDINQQQKGHRDLLYDSLVFKDKYRKEAINHFKQHYNFFKHSDRDPNKTIDFNPLLTEIFIMLSSVGLELFGIKPNIIRGAFNIWFFIQYPTWLTEKGKKQISENIPIDNILKIRNIPRGEFFNAYKLLRSQFIKT